MNSVLWWRLALCVFGFLLYYAVQSPFYQIILSVMFWQRLFKPERWKFVGDRRRYTPALRCPLPGIVRPQLGLPGGRMCQHRPFPLHGLRRHRQDTHQDTRPVPQRCGKCVFDSFVTRLSASSHKRNVMVWRLSVRLSVPSLFLMLTDSVPSFS